MNLKIQEVVKAAGGRLLHGSGESSVTGISIDSRALVPGQLFFALPGERFDGNQFVPAALAAGAVAVVASRPPDLKGTDLNSQAVILVQDPREALQRLARYWRTQFAVPVIGVTGSNGKTTTKDLVAAVLEARWPVLKNQGNMNNEIGLPLTLLQLESWHQAVVLEMGMRGLRQIEFLCSVASPTGGVVTNVGTAHMELLGDQANIARAKGELLENLPSDGFAVLNGDDFWCRSLGPRCPARVVYYGLGQDADVRAANLRFIRGRGTGFTVYTGGQEAEALIPLPGEHNVKNALAAIGVGLQLGLSLAETVHGLSGARLSGMRLEIKPGCRGSTIINDVYNANPASMKASLHVLALLREGRAVAVLGDMFELGPATVSGHQEVGLAAARMGLDLLVTVGSRALHIADAAVEAGLPAKQVHHFGSKTEAADFVKEFLREGDVVLVKASRGMKLEEVVNQLVVQPC